MTFDPHRLRRLLALAALLGALLTVAASVGEAQAFSNGRMPRSALAEIPGPSPSVHTYLRRDAAAAFNTMALAAAGDGVALYPGGAASAYRTLAQQVFLRSQWCARGACQNAAVPGTSNHGLGLAVDLGRPGPMRAWIDRHGQPFGWCKCWSDAPWEVWHVKWRVGVWRSHPNPGPDVHAPILRRGSGGVGQAAWVRFVQKRVHAHVTGFYGRSTQRAVWRFQHARKLHAGGVVGPATWRALRTADKHVLPDSHSHSTHKPHKPPKAVVAPAPGVDVSSYQRSVDWRKVRHAGIRWAIVKSSEGVDYRDPLYTRQRVHALHVAGLFFGPYHFLRPRPGRSAVVEATFAVRAARAGGWRPSRDLPFTMDFESSTLAPAETLRYAVRFASTVRRLSGRPPVVYSFPGFLNVLPGHGAALAGYRLWIAHFRVARPLVPSPWRGFTAWQFNDQGRVAGIAGHVDVDIMAGGMQTVRRLALRSTR